MTKTISIYVFSLLVFSFALVACGDKAAAISDIPVFTGAVELKPGESTIANSLQKNGAQDAAMRQATNMGGSVVQKGFSLPKDTTGSAVHAFYDEKMKAAGWTNGLGGAAGQFIDVNKVIGAANQGNEMFQPVIYTKDKQSLTVLYLADPVKEDNRQLILSLSSN